jgi:hypothetical protein
MVKCTLHVSVNAGKRVIFLMFRHIHVLLIVSVVVFVPTVRAF